MKRYNEEELTTINSKLKEGLSLDEAMMELRKNPKWVEEREEKIRWKEPELTANPVFRKKKRESTVDGNDNGLFTYDP